VGGVSHFVADLGVIITDAMRRYGRDGFCAWPTFLITNHQAVAGQAPQQRGPSTRLIFHNGELLMFAMVRAQLDRTVGGHEHLASAQAPTVADPWLEGLQLDQLKIYEAGKLNEKRSIACSRTTFRFPESSLGDMKSQNGGVPACCAAHGRAVRQIRARKPCSRRSRASFDETEAKCRNVGIRSSQDGRLRSAGGARRGTGCYGRASLFRSAPKVTIEKRARWTIDLSPAAHRKRRAAAQFAYARRRRAVGVPRR